VFKSQTPAGESPRERGGARVGRRVLRKKFNAVAQFSLERFTIQTSVSNPSGGQSASVQKRNRFGKIAGELGSGNGASHWSIGFSLRARKKEKTKKAPWTHTGRKGRTLGGERGLRLCEIAEHLKDKPH